jgi:hypothetical protein
MVNPTDEDDWDERCPIEDCDGGLPDRQGWLDSLARLAHPEYPEEPVLAGNYPAN